MIAVHKRLTARKVSHAFSGDLAIAYYTEPSPRNRIDVNVFVSTERWQDVRDALAPLGVTVDDLDVDALERDNQCRLWWGQTPVDLFFAYDAIHEEMPKETRRVPFANTTVPILSPEHLAVCKAMFDRPKDWLDIEQILGATDSLDPAVIEGWLKRMVGEGDPRLLRFEELKDRLSISD